MDNRLIKTFVFPVHSYESMWNKQQERHELVVRWAEYQKNNPNLPIQTNLHHLVSVCRLVHYILCHISSEHPTLDVRLLLDAILFHEDGEMGSEGDTLYHNKTNSGHLKELLVFDQGLVGDDRYKALMKKAFLLQFVADEKVNFRSQNEYQAILDTIRVRYQMEGQMVSACERYDYYLYAHRAYRVHGDVVIMTHVLRNQKEHLDRYASSIKGFDAFWSKDLSEVAKDFLASYEDIPPPKDEDGNSLIKEAYDFARRKNYMP